MLVRTEPVHMSSDDLGLRNTPARADFKRIAGQNNHFLITVLVGLDAVHDGTATLNAEFSTSWSPTDVKQSSMRSREYVLVTSLAWITDLVDVYRKRLQAMPSVVRTNESSRINNIDGRATKLAEIAKVLRLENNDRNLSMLQFAIKWRNMIVHSDADSRVGSQLKANLSALSTEIADAHRGLDIGRAINSFEKGHAPTFKEVASFIAAAQQLVASLDSRAIETMDMREYADSRLREHLTSTFDSNPQVFSQFWPGNIPKSEHRIRSLLLQLGFTDNKPAAPLSGDYLADIARLSAKEARKRFTNPNGD